MSVSLSSVAFEDGRDRSAAPAGTAEVGDLWRILWARRRWIVAAVLACLALAIVYVGVTPKQYSASAQLFIDPRDRQIVTKDVNPDALAPDGGVLMVESQSRVIESDTVLLRAIVAQRLDTDPDYGGTKHSLFTAISDAFQSIFGEREADGPDAAQYRALRALRRNLTVKRAEKVFVVDVIVSAFAPDKAARIADAIAEAYLADQVASRSQSSLRASDALSERLADLRDGLRDAENRVERYRAQHDLVGTQKQLVSDQDLDESGLKLTNARAKTAEMRARINQIEALRRSGVDDGAITEAIQSSVITQLRASYTALLRQETDLRTRVGDRHPDLVAVVAQVQETRRQIDAELTRLARAARADYDRALADERALAHALDASKKATLDNGKASVEWRELQRDVEARRALYQSFLSRSAETKEQADVDTSNARILSKAIPPNKASWPMTGFILLGAVGGGLGLGMGLAFVLEYLKPTILSFRQLQRVIEAPVIGVLDARRAAEQRADGAMGLALSRLCGPLNALKTAPAPYTLLVTSGVRDGAARIDTIDRLVVAAADCNVAVLLVEADLTKSNGKTLGFLDVLRGDCGFNKATTQKDAVRVRRIAVGQSQGQADEVRDETIAPFLEKAGRYFDLVVFDIGAVESNLRLAPLLTTADGILIVAVKGVTPQSDALRVGDAVAAASGRPLSGALLCEQAA